MRAAETIRDAVVAWCRSHEPSNFIAFLAHTAGIRSTPESIREFVAHLQGYEQECANCSHMRN